MTDRQMAFVFVEGMLLSPAIAFLLTVVGMVAAVKYVVAFTARRVR